VVLYREGRFRDMPDAFNGVVVQIDVRHGCHGRVERVGIDGKVVVLGGDFNLPGCQVLDGVIAPVVAELQAVRPAAQRQAEELMTQANAH